MFYPTHKHHSSFGHVAVALLAVLMIGGSGLAEEAPLCSPATGGKSDRPASRVRVDEAGVPDIHPLLG